MSPRQQAPLTIEHALLGFVREQPLHPYALYQQIIAPMALGLVWQPKLSYFYTLVKKLEQAHYLTVRVEPQGLRPSRKVLAVTSAGEAAFLHWRTAPVDDPAQVSTDFLARLYFAERAGPASVQALLSAQRSVSRGWHTHMQAEMIKRGHQAHAGHFLQLQVRQVESFVLWLEQNLEHLHTAPAVTYQIAITATSAYPELAAAFIAYVHSPQGQAVLLNAGFSTDTRPIPASISLASPNLSDTTPILHIFAAASLTGPFQTIGSNFNTIHPEVMLHFTFGGSQRLAEQICQGAVADVFAVAHHQAMDLVLAAGQIWHEQVSAFASNQLAVVTPKQNPAQLYNLADLARSGIRLAVGSSATAIGQYTHAWLDQVADRGVWGSAGKEAVLHNVVYYGESVTDVVTAVTTGEVDAGIVFASDGCQAHDMVAIPITVPYSPIHSAAS